MRTIICILLTWGFSIALQAQSIVGNWQLLKQTSCIEDNMTATTDSAQLLIDEMKNMSSATPQVITFKEKMTGEESTRILSKKKAAYSKNFLYKFDGEMLLILDKKSQTITDNYTVDKFSADSLIISNASRPCETKIFVRIK